MDLSDTRQQDKRNTFVNSLVTYGLRVSLHRQRLQGLISA
jgi:hypothetical protein